VRRQSQPNRYRFTPEVVDEKLRAAQVLRAAADAVTLAKRHRMWCPHCQRDVPQTAASASASRTCSRCGRTVAFVSDVHQAHKPVWRSGNDDGLDLAATATGPPAPLDCAMWDEWTLAAEVQRARHLLNGGSDRNLAADWRLDVIHPRNVKSVGPVERPARFSASYRGRKLRTSWRKASQAALALGIAAFGYGVASAVSLIDTSGTLSRFGVPLMLIGLFGLVLGLLIQVLSISRASSAAVDRMRLVELRLQEYRQAALLVSPVSQVGAAHHAAHLGRAVGAEFR
jgi:hypothetical protein